MKTFFSKIWSGVKKFWKWITFGIIGTTAIAMTLNGGTQISVDLIPIYSVATYRFNTYDGLLHDKEYAIDELGYMIYDFNSGVFFKRIDDLDTMGMKKIEIADRWGKAYSYFKDPETQKRLKYEITKEEYQSYKTRKGLPNKIIEKEISYQYILKRFAGLFKVNSATAAIARYNSDAVIDNDPVTSITFAHDSGSAANRVLVVGSTTNSSTGLAATYNDVSLNVAIGAAAQIAWVSILEMNDTEETMATGSNNVVVTQTVATFMYGTAATYQDAGVVSTTQSANGTGNNPTLNITTTGDNSYIFDNVAGNAAATFVPDGSQTELADGGTGGAIKRANSDLQGGVAGAHTMSWTTTGNSYWDQVAVEITEDVAPTPTPPPPVPPAGDDFILQIF